MVDLSVVILEYHSLSETDQIIKHWESCLGNLSHEIIISSNSCYSDNIRQELSSKITSVIWSFNEINGGFAYGMNRGLEKASGRYLIIANSDVKFLSGINELIGFMDRTPHIGAVGPKIVDKNGVVQDSCRPYVSLPSFLLRHFRRILFRKEIVLSKKINYNKVQTVDWVAGAFILVSRAAYEKTNGLDEGFFMYAEDVDWCYRIRKSGFEIAYFPQAIAEYEGSRSARTSRKYRKIFWQSHFRLWKKHGLLWANVRREKNSFS